MTALELAPAAWFHPSEQTSTVAVPARVCALRRRDAATAHALEAYLSTTRPDYRRSTTVLSL